LLNPLMLANAVCLFLSSFDPSSFIVEEFIEELSVEEVESALSLHAYNIEAATAKTKNFFIVV